MGNDLFPFWLRRNLKILPMTENRGAIKQKPYFKQLICLSIRQTALLPAGNGLRSEALQLH